MVPKAPIEDPALIADSLTEAQKTELAADKASALADESKSAPSPDKSSTSARPWYARGGMHANNTGMGVNIVVPVYVLWKLAFAADDESTKTWGRVFLATLALSWFLAFAAYGMRTVFCILVAPTYLTSSLLIFALYSSGATTLHPVMVLLAAVFLAIAKVGICMSVCLHRYAAHAAFKCSNTMRLLVNILGCLANQGGPIWWASMHRCHHKYCDVPRDPHSAVQDGTEHAFCFFERHSAVEEEFAPLHNDTYLLRVMDTFSCVFVSCELLLWYHFGGPTGLYIGFTSAWICQTITLWFNIVNHPAEIEKECKAANYNGAPKTWYPPFLVLNALYPLFSLFVGEKNHEHHHNHVALANRGENDAAYWVFIWPLEKLGLVWNVKQLTTA